MKTASHHDLGKLDAAVRRRIGLNPATLGADSLQLAVGRCLAGSRPRATGEDLGQWLHDESQFQRLTEELLVPETWFFRDVIPFRCLRWFVSERRGKRPEAGPLRVLSAGCSTGEEAYSIGMTLLDLGLAPRRFRVEAVDLSHRALERAVEGIYSESSFRRLTPEFSDLWHRFGERLEDGRYRIGDEVRAVVHFRQANLASQSFLAGEPVYEVIFCRNVLIYFHDEARQTTLGHLRRLLSPDGMLYVGHAEAGAVVAAGPFVGISAEFPFAFRLAETAVRADGRAPPRRAPCCRASTERPAFKGPARAPSSASAHGPTQKDAPPQETVPHRSGPVAALVTASVASEGKSDRLAEARQAADAGRLDEAEALCLRALADQPTSADAYYLLGVVEQARADLAGAQKLYQKALYLDPKHHESLVHAMLLARHRGDHRLAEAIRRRVEQTGEAWESGS